MYDFSIIYIETSYEYNPTLINLLRNVALMKRFIWFLNGGRNF